MAAALVVGKVLGKTFNIDVNKEKCYNTKSGTATNRFACITWMTQHLQRRSKESESQPQLHSGVASYTLSIKLTQYVLRRDLLCDNCAPLPAERCA